SIFLYNTSIKTNIEIIDNINIKKIYLITPLINLQMQNLQDMQLQNLQDMKLIIKKLKMNTHIKKICFTYNFIRGTQEYFIDLIIMSLGTNINITSISFEK